MARRTHRDPGRSRRTERRADASSIVVANRGRIEERQALPDGAAVEPAALVLTFRFRPAVDGDGPYAARVRIKGRRLNVTGPRSPRDSFTKVETVDGVIPGSGDVTVTSWVYGVTTGSWDVSAELLPEPRPRYADSRATELRRATWSWRRWRLEDTPASPLRTRAAVFAPFAASPAVLPGVFPVLAGLSFVAAIAVQMAALPHEGVVGGAFIGATILGLAAGIVGAKAWYIALRGSLSRQTLREGWSVDGFLVTAPLVALAAVLVAGGPAGGFLDATTPGIFLAVAVGRVGCFLTGCCSGRATASRFGLWSSDRRIGMRQIPTQLLEGAIGLSIAALSAVVGLSIAALSAVVVLSHIGRGAGVLFLLSLASYLACRQALLRLRAEARPFSWRRALSWA